MTQTIPHATSVEETARILKCLGHPARLRILDRLECEGEQTVSQLQAALGLEQAAMSQHLTLMRDKGVLGRRKDGVFALYWIADPRALKVLECVRQTAGAL